MHTEITQTLPANFVKPLIDPVVTKSVKPTSAQGMFRPRQKMEDWKKRLFVGVGLDPYKEENSSLWFAARSKTVYFIYGDKNKPRQISSRQYVLYARRDSEIPIVQKINNEVLPRVKDLKEKQFSVIGFWRAQRWEDDKILILIDRDDFVKKKSGDEPGAFEIVGMAYDGKYTFQKDDIYSELRPFLNIVENVTDAPGYTFVMCPDSLSKDVKPFASKCFERAKEFWDKSFTKNVSTVTKSRFETMTHIPLVMFDPLTRLKSVVEKDDWMKIAVFLSYDCNGIKTIVDNKAEFEEAAALIRDGILHFSMTTMTDDYDFSKSDCKLHIMPAFRLWQYGFYMLFIRVGDVVHRFFLCKHYAGDPLMFSYDPYRDNVNVFPVIDRQSMSKQFFYLVPRSPEERTEQFDSLTDVRNRVMLVA